MANHKLSVTDNGTKTLLTAGKYCDRNIDVEVNVPKGLQPTKFTNILELDTTIVKEGYRAVTDTYSETRDGVAIVVPLKKGTHDIRVRGKWAWQFLTVAISVATGGIARTNVYFSTTTPTADAHGGAFLFNYSFDQNRGSFNIDEYGDWYMTTTVSSDGWLAFTLKDMSAVFPDGTFSCNPIITIDEPIGYVEVT